MGERGETDEKRTVADDRVGRLIKDAIKRQKALRRHPFEVTVDRLGEHLMDPRCDSLTGIERDAFSVVIQVLTDVAEGER